MSIISLLRKVSPANNPKRVVTAFFPQLLAEIECCYGNTFAQKVHTYIFGNPPTCYCGNILKWESFRSSYRGKFCSVKCRSNNSQFVSAWYASRHQNKTQEELDEINYKNSQSNIKASLISQPKIQATKRANGTIKSEADKTAMELYREQVRFYTEQQPLFLLENYNKRGNHATNKNAWHLDHIVSIRDGFVNNIPPYIIGNIHNLRMLPWRDNIVKHGHSEMPLDQLIEQVLKDKTSEQRRK